MEPTISKEIDELVEELKKSGHTLDDPVAKLMVTALLYQAQKVKDSIDALPEKVMERLCACFIPKNKIDAMPALCCLQARVKGKKVVESHHIMDGAYFNYRVDAKTSLQYYPLYRNCLIPYSSLHLQTAKFLDSDGMRRMLTSSAGGQVWLGLQLPPESEVESLKDVAFYIKGTKGVLPQRIYVGSEMRELTFVTADCLSEIPMMPPFDAQQANSSFIEVMAHWQSILTHSEEGRLVYITDPLTDRDVFKCRAYPKAFQQILECADLDKFDNNTLWILFDFGKEFQVVDNLEILPNVVPVVNVQINAVTLTQSSPIAKLSKNDSSYFLNVVETSTQAQKTGFNAVGEDVLIRDFDNASYNPESLYRDVRKLYNRFVDDYHAFIGYNGLKDGELVRSLREIVNRVGKSVVVGKEVKDRFEEGTYVMKSVRLTDQPLSVKVSYLTTFGRLGNAPISGAKMECRKDAGIESETKVVVSALGGENKAGADQRYELLRYYTLTADRLFTKADIDAFLRMSLLREFGREEMKRIEYDIKVQGAGASLKLTRGLYIDVKFKDDKNYIKAAGMALDRKLRQLILDNSCLTMPVIVRIENIDGGRRE